MSKRKKRRGYISGEKTEEKQNSVTIMMSVDEKGTVFPVRLKLEGESIEWRFYKRKFLKRSNEFNWDKSPD